MTVLFSQFGGVLLFFMAAGVSILFTLWALQYSLLMAFLPMVFGGASLAGIGELGADCEADLKRLVAWFGIGLLVGPAIFALFVFLFAASGVAP